METQTEKIKKVENEMYVILAYGDKIEEDQYTVAIDAVFNNIIEAEHYMNETIEEIYEMDVENIVKCNYGLVEVTQRQVPLYDVIYDDGNVSYPLFSLVKQKIETILK